jgi:MSHA type pilus biogenesis protein MshL
MRTSVRVAPAPSNPASPPALPQLSESPQPALSTAPQQRISQIDVEAGTPISTAVMQLGTQLGLTVTVDPDVRGTTQLSLRNVTLDEALFELVSRHGFAYQLQGNVLRVMPVRMETRTFHVDYVAMSRTGSMSTVVQRRLSQHVARPLTDSTLGAAPTIPDTAVAIGNDVLTAQSVADIWQEIRVSLSGIIQAGQAGRENPTGAADATPSFVTQRQPQSGAAGPSASSIPFADGSSLVISPMSGLISITALPEKLTLAEAFINEFQASVLRQVLIEAKIVEVNLSNAFPYGIDWNAISSSGQPSFTLSNDPATQTTGNAGNVNFTLTGGSAQINAVLAALSTQGSVSVLSNDKTSALNNQRAIFQVTTDAVFFSVTRTPLYNSNGGIVSTQSSITPQQVSVGVVLDVLPQISADNMLTMDIRPAVTNIDHVETISLADGTTASAPSISRREGDTIARLRAGETMIIGGLVQRRKDTTNSGIPILKDIPLVGRIFQHVNHTETHSELVIFLTPTIISGSPVTGR